MSVEKRLLAGMVTIGVLIAGCSSSSALVPTETDIPVAQTGTTLPLANYAPEFPEPVAVLEAFMQAEMAADFEKSFGFLSASDQEQASDAAEWTADHFMILPTIEGYQISSDSSDGIRSEVNVALALRSELDQLAGLTTATADSTWVLVDEQNVWRIALTESTIVSVYLDDETADQAVEMWAQQRQQCTPALQWDQTLVGFPSLADALCGANGSVEVGPVQALSDAAEAAAFLAAFGPEVGLWARVVEVKSPAALRVVVAPIGEQWLVIGVLEPSSS